MPIDFLQLGVAGGTLATLIIVARLFYKQSHDLMDHEAAQQDQILEFFGNHMSENIKTQVRIAKSLEHLAAEVRYYRIAESGVRAEGDAERIAREGEV